MTIGLDHSCILTNDDRIECWGEIGNNQLKVPKDLKNIHDFMAGSYTSCALYGDDRELRCFGESNNQTLGFPKNFKNIQKFTVGYQYVCVIRKIDEQDKLEYYSTRNQNVVNNIPKDFGEIESLHAGYYNACAKNTKNELTCWGNNGTGVPNGTIMEKVKRVSIQGTGLCYFHYSGDLSCHGQVSNSSPIFLKNNLKVERTLTTLNGTCVEVSGKYTCVGYFRDQFITHLNKLSKEAKIYAGLFNICSIDGGKVECSGATGDNRLKIPGEVVNASSLKVGEGHICAELQNQIICWGKNNWGQTVIPRDLGHSRKISIGFDHNCALDEKGPICWGSNRFGQSIVPRDIYRKNVVNIISGAFSNCAVIEDGSYECWGQITQDEIDFINFNASDIKSLFLRVEHTCLLTKAGVAKCFGKNNTGQINVPKLKNKVKGLSVGYDHSCLITEKDELKCWGNEANSKRFIMTKN